MKMVKELCIIAVTVGMLFAVLSLGGCATAQQAQSATVGRVGCTKSEIAVSDFDSSFFTSNWSVTCKNKKFYCNGINTYLGAIVMSSCAKNE